MSSKITEEVQDRTEQVPGPRGAEMAPSVIRQEEPQLARTIGLCSLLLALLFTLGFLRHETEVDWRTMAVNLVGGLGAVLAVGGLGFSLISENFLLPNGLLLGLLALAFLWAFVAVRGKADDLSYQV